MNKFAAPCRRGVRSGRSCSSGTRCFESLRVSLSEPAVPLRPCSMAFPATAMATGAVTRSFSRAKLADGRVSLFAHMFGGAEQGRSITGVVQSNVVRARIFFIGAGLVGAAFFGQRHLLNSPDVKLSGPTRRMSNRPRDEHEEMARRFTTHRQSFARTLPGHTSKAQWPGYKGKPQ